MKRIFYLLLALPVLLFLSSCDDDNDLPDVSLSIEYDGAVEDDGVLYVVQGDTLNVIALRAVPAEGTKEAAISAVGYFWDGIPQGETNISPFPISIVTTDIEAGSHYLGVNATVLQVGKEVGFAVAYFPVTIVAAESDLPDDSSGNGAIASEVRMSDRQK